MWVGVGAGVGVGVGIDFSKPESESESESLKFGRLRSPGYKVRNIGHIRPRLRFCALC